MSEENIDKVLREAAERSRLLDPALLERVKAELRPSMAPVRPLPAAWVLATGLIVICAAVGIVGALFLGPLGVRKMNPTQIAAIFPTLGLLMGLVAAYYAGAMVPGSRIAAPRWTLPAIVCVSLIVLFAMLFHDYRTERFVTAGLVCLKAGLLHALPAALASWWLLRRGFAVDSAAAGLAQGTLAGLAGVLMLEIHCVNFEAPHVMVWHVAVVPLSAAAGAAFFRARSVRRRPAL
ncbi:MAG: NrsF family protein [Candidatus Solibacter sp.]